MCGSTKAPDVVQQNPAADQAKAEAEATQEANAELAQRRKRLAQNSLLTLGASGTARRVKTPGTLLAAIDPGSSSAPRLNSTLLGPYGPRGQRSTLG